MLDEPTSAVDPQSRRDFWESLFTLVGRGITILVSTHYMDEAERCHRLAILAEGRVVAEGEPKQLMADIAASVIEIEATTRPGRLARRWSRTTRCAAWRSSARGCTRLLDPSVDTTCGARRCAIAGRRRSTRSVTQVHASLEDVFVAATGFGAGARGRSLTACCSA